jgi:molybdopterin-guanine dinucleotide biosynthesis protein
MPALNGVHTAAIRGLPELPVFCWVQGKAPRYREWNAPKNLKTPAQLFEETPPAGSAADPFTPTGFGLVSGRWSGTMAVDFDANPERLHQAEETFRNVTGFSSDALPPSATIVSGRPGRRRVILKVPQEWYPALSGYSAKLLDLELRWEGKDENHNPTPIQSVICGPHPDDPEWFFRWQEGLSAEEVGIAEAPVWLLAAMARRRGVDEALAEERQETSHRSAGEPGPCDLLPPRLQKVILQSMSDFWPFRGGPAGTRWQGSWHEDGYVMLLGALHNIIGAEMAFEWLAETDWFKNHKDWGRSHDMVSAIRSVGKSSTAAPAGWGALWYLATRTESRTGTKFKEPGWSAPSWAKPPRDPLEQVNELQKLIVQMNDAESDPVKMALLVGHVKKIGVTESTIYRLRLDAALGTAEQSNSRTLAAVEENTRTDNKTTDVIDGLLRRRVVCLAGASNSGKTTLAAMLASRVVTGTPLNIGGVLHNVDRGRVLWMGSDTSDLAVAEELALQGIDSAKAGDAVRVVAGASFNNLLRIVQEIQTHQPDLIIMDCLSSMSVAGVSVADPAFSEPMRILQRHNGVAWPRCAFLLLHHTTRDTPKRFSGGEQIKAAVEAMWIYYDPALTTKKKGDEDKPANESPLRRLWIAPASVAKNLMWSSRPPRTAGRFAPTPTVAPTPAASSTTSSVHMTVMNG